MVECERRRIRLPFLFLVNLKLITLSFLKGSIDSSKRYDIVTQFNNDPTIEVLLLTTRVGGLGLNLTGADTVGLCGCVLYVHFVRVLLATLVATNNGHNGRITLVTSGTSVASVASDRDQCDQCDQRASVTRVTSVTSVTV